MVMTKQEIQEQAQNTALMSNCVSCNRYLAKDDMIRTEIFNEYICFECASEE